MANEETGFGTIKCPGCGEAIPFSTSQNAVGVILRTSTALTYCLSI